MWYNTNTKLNFLSWHCKFMPATMKHWQPWHSRSILSYIRAIYVIATMTQVVNLPPWHCLKSHWNFFCLNVFRVQYWVSRLEIYYDSSNPGWKSLIFTTFTSFFILPKITKCVMVANTFVMLFKCVSSWQGVCHGEKQFAIMTQKSVLTFCALCGAWMNESSWNWTYTYVAQRI